MKLIYSYKEQHRSMIKKECRLLWNKEISMPSENSKIQTNVEVEPDSTYRVTIKARNTSGNGVIFCNFFANTENDFAHHKICVNSDIDKEFTIKTRIPNFSSTKKILFRIWKVPELCTGNVIIKDITIYKLAEDIEVSKTPKLSIIIPVFNHKEVTKRCLDSLVPHTELAYELIVVDNGSTDGTDKMIKENYNGVKILKQDKNLGFAKACNQGILQARGEYILLLNNDIKVLQPRWYAGMLCTLEHADITGAAAGVLNLDTFRYLKETNKVDDDYHYIVGWCMMFKRAVIDKVGLLTEEFGMGLFEDTVFCIKARMAGLRVVVTEGVPLFHYGHATIRDLGFMRLYNDNRDKFIRRYGQDLIKLEMKKELNVPKIFSKLKNEPFQFVPGKVSIITLNYNGINMLKVLIPSVMKNARYPFFEWIICDNGSKDDSVIYIKEMMRKHRNIILFDRKNNRGNFSSINNEAAKLADGEFLVFLNNDMEAKEDWLTEMVRIVRSDPNVSIVGSFLKYPHNKIQHAGIFFTERGPGNFCYLNMNSLPDTFHLFDREFRAVTGACLLIRHSDFLSVGRFCENFEYCFEDVDLCLSVRKNLRKKVIYAANSKLIHNESFTTRKTNKKINFNSNIELLKKRWPSTEMSNDYNLFKKNSQHGIYNEPKISVEDLYKELGVNVLVCIDDFGIYKKYLKASILQRFQRPVHLVEIDNTKQRYTSIATALNEHLNNLPYNMTIIAHQDMEFSNGFDVELIKKICGLKNPGIVGLAGVTNEDVPIGILREADGELWNKTAKKTGQVPIIDECCMVFANNPQFRFDDKTFTSFHFYGCDLCLESLKAGYRNYVVDAPAVHHSDDGKRSIKKTSEEMFLGEMKKLKNKWIDMFPVIRTTTVKLTKDEEIVYVKV